MTSLWENNRKIQVPRLYVNILTELISYPRAQNSNIHIKNHPADDITMGKQQKNTSPQIECEYYNYFKSLYRIHEHRIKILISKIIQQMTSLWENNRKIQVPRLNVNILTELISYPRAQNSNIHIKNHPADDITMGKQQKNTSPQIVCEYSN